MKHETLANFWWLFNDLFVVFTVRFNQSLKWFETQKTTFICWPYVWCLLVFRVAIWTSWNQTLVCVYHRMGNLIVKCSMLDPIETETIDESSGGHYDGKGKPQKDFFVSFLSSPTVRRTLPNAANESAHFFKDCGARHKTAIWCLSKHLENVLARCFEVEPVESGTRQLPVNLADSKEFRWSSHTIHARTSPDSIISSSTRCHWWRELLHRHQSSSCLLFVSLLPMSNQFSGHLKNFRCCFIVRRRL